MNLCVIRWIRFLLRVSKECVRVILSARLDNLHRALRDLPRQVPLISTGERIALVFYLSDTVQSVGGGTVRRILCPRDQNHWMNWRSVETWRRGVEIYDSL